jgi:hypothetical protein
MRRGQHREATRAEGARPTPDVHASVQLFCVEWQLS